MLQSLLFIINPNSGVGKHHKIIDTVASIINNVRFSYTFEYTKYAGHAKEIALKAVKDNINIVVAVGGDGTVNEVASSLIGSNTALAIIPLGSGNGFARHLQIPINVEKSIQLINNHQTIRVDTCLLNNTPFICTSGIGFDAFISHQFDKTSKRGFLSYIRLSINSFIQFKQKEYTVITDNEEKQYAAFSIGIANANQYGNEAKIAPHASLRDGLMQIVIIRKPSVLNVISTLFKLFTNRFPSSKYVTTFTSSKVQITPKDPKEFFTHIDGDIFNNHQQPVDYSIKPKSLLVICDKNKTIK